MNEPKNILIVRTDRIGDVILTIPIAKIIKDRYPHCRVSFLLKNYTKPLVENNPYIDKVLILDEKNGTLELSSNLNKIKKENFDTAIIVYPRFRISLIIFLAGIKTRIGTGYRWYSFLFNKKIYEHRKTGDKHELEYNLNLLSKLGIKDITKKDVSFDIHPSLNSEQHVNKLFDEYHIDRSQMTIIVHPGSGGSSINLPIDNFIKLTGMLAQVLRCNIIITGSDAERALCEKFVVNEKIKNFAGLLNLDELSALIGKSELLIANSTGPIHIAAAKNKYVVGFYPKINECSAKRWGPYTDKKIIFEPAIDCKNCTREQCEKLNCMNSIDIKEVKDKVVGLLSNSIYAENS